MNLSAEEVLAGPEYFDCERLHARMRKAVCIKRQVDGFRITAGDYVPEACKACGQGRRIREEAGMGEKKMCARCEEAERLVMKNGRVSRYCRKCLGLVRKEAAAKSRKERAQASPSATPGQAGGDSPRGADAAAEETAQASPSATPGQAGGGSPRGADAAAEETARRCLSKLDDIGALAQGRMTVAECLKKRSELKAMKRKMAVFMADPAALDLKMSLEYFVPGGMPRLVAAAQRNMRTVEGQAAWYILEGLRFDEDEERMVQASSSATLGETRGG